MNRDPNIYFQSSQRPASNLRNSTRNTTENPIENVGITPFTIGNSRSRINFYGCSNVATSLGSNQGINRLSNQNLDCSFESRRLPNEISDLKDPLQNLESELTREKYRNNEKHQKEISDLNQQITETVFDYEKLKQKYRALKESSTKQTNEIQNLKQTIQDQQIDIDKKDKKIQDLKNKINVKDRTIQDQQIDIDKKDKTIQDLNNKIDKKDRTIQNQQIDIDKKDKKIQDLNNKIDKKDRTIQNQQIDIDKKDKKIQDLKNQINERDRTIQNQQIDIDKKDKKIQDLKNQINERDRTIQNQQDTIKDQQDTIWQNEDNITTKDKMIEELKKHLNLLRKRAVLTYNSCDFALLIPKVQTYISQYAQYLLQIAKGNETNPPSATEIEKQITDYSTAIRSLAAQFLNTPYKKYNIPIIGDFTVHNSDFTCSFVQETDVRHFQELCNNWKEVGQKILSTESVFTQVIQDKMDAFTNTILKFPDIQKLMNKCNILLSKIKQYQTTIRNLARELENAKQKIKELEELKESLNKTIGLYELNKKEQDINIHNLRQIVAKQMAVAKKENEIQINQMIKMHQEEIQNLIQCFQ